MLCRLQIQDIAVIEAAEITLDRGFTALTGETGAGKSLIIDAILMVLGGRTGREIIRHGARCAVSEAAFFCQHPLADEDGMLVLRRELFADGRNLCSINGKMVTVSGLREAAQGLLAIHGQHDTEELLHRASHLSYVDDYAGNAEILTEYKALYEKRNALRAEIESLQTDDGEKLRRMEMLDFWIQEIEEAALTPGEDEILEEKRERLRHAEKIQKGIAAAYSALSGEEVSARDLLSDAARALENAAEYDTRLAEKAEEVRDILYKAEEIAGDLSAMDVEEDREALAEIEERLDIIFKLKKKYGQTIDEILAYLDTLSAEREAFETSDEKLRACSEALAKAEEKLQKTAEKLTKSRTRAAKEIAQKTEAELAALDMEKVRFSVEISPRDPGETGADTVEFFISTNPGEPPKPLSKIASGGELSRVCLALRTVLSESAKAQGLETMIFDEIDTGISGRAAGRVGAALSQLAENKQVLCVTHLPQIAACAASQFKIDKNEESGRFVTRVSRLEKSERIAEIARMISGDRITGQTLKTAEEMLD